MLAQIEPFFFGCIGFIDGTLIKIKRPADLPGADAKRFYTRRKKIYAFNNTIVVDHEGFIIYIDEGYPGSYHDVTILRESSLYKDWVNYFSRQGDYVEFLLGDREAILAVLSIVSYYVRQTSWILGRRNVYYEAS